MSSKKIKYTAEQLERAVEFLLSGGEGKPGFSPTISVSELTNGTRLTITDKDGTQIVDILNGKDGADGGKSAYDYAKEGGYAGTEDEFYKKLAQEAVTYELKATDDGNGKVTLSI